MAKTLGWEKLKQRREAEEVGEAWRNETGKMGELEVEEGFVVERKESPEGGGVLLAVKEHVNILEEESFFIGGERVKNSRQMSGGCN